jgi:hypothetical protein
MNGYTFYQIYQPLQLHFTTEKYDVIKYNGKSLCSYEKFLQKPAYGRFEMIGAKFTDRKKAGQFVIANIMYGDMDFVYGPFQDAQSVYNKWLGVRESITKKFEDDLDLMLSKIESSKWFDKTPSGRNPPLLQMILKGDVLIETAIILNKEHKGFLDKWAEICDNDPYVKKVIMRYKKYVPFVKYEADKITRILQEKLESV